MFSKEVLGLEQEMIQWRRYLHAHAELSFEEYETTRFLTEKMKDLPGVSLSFPTKTGVVAVLKGNRPGKTIAFRADIDALPIREENNLPYCSVRDGVMHACGHDGHAAMQLAAVTLLSKEADRLCGEARFLFQHAEEKPPGGAAEMFDAGVMDGVEELYGFHLSSSFPTGKFGVRAGALTSATDRFEIVITGSEGHSAFPELCTDPVVTAAEVILALQTIVSRKVAAAEPAVVSVCEVHAGDVYNVIPQEVKISGAVRTFSEQTRESMPAWMEQIIRGITQAHGASFRLDYQRGYASVINDAGLARLARNVIEETFGEDAAFDIGPLMPGEDFSALEKNCPAFFVELGSRCEAKGCTAPHHNRHYLLDEDALKYGAEYICRIARNRLG